jgi:ketosteroid isomerase-like protein
MEQDITAIALDFITTLQNRKSSMELMKFYHPDVRQIEFPNTLTKAKTVRTLEDLKNASERGTQVLQKETYEILRSFTTGNTVIIEAIWTGVLALPLGAIPIGGEMKAYFAQFYEFQDGKIISQRNYDCFEPHN